LLAGRSKDWTVWGRNSGGGAKGEGSSCRTLISRL
jgi:hypothetical protein